MVGVVGTFSLPVTCVIPCADSCTIICAVRQRHRYEFGDFPVMAGDCGDEIPSKSKPQSAGITSSANPMRIFSLIAEPYSSCPFFFHFRELRESSKNSINFLIHLLKVLPCLLSVTSFFFCKVILFLLLPPFRVAVPLRSLPSTASPISTFLPNYLQYDKLPPTPLHSTPPSCPFSAAHSCIYTPVSPNNSSLFLRWSAAIPGCRSEHFVRKLPHLSDGTPLFLTALFLWRPPCLAPFEAFRPLPEFLPLPPVAGMHSSPSLPLASWRSLSKLQR